jgi:hypothetical protein
VPTSDSDGQDERHRGKRYVELEVDDDMIIGPSGSGSCLEYCSDCVFFFGLYLVSFRIVFEYSDFSQGTQFLEFADHTVYIFNLDTTLPWRWLGNLDRLQPDLSVQPVVAQTLLVQLLLLRLHNVG